MAGRISRQGKKFAGRHSSYIELAGGLVDFMVKQDEVDKISAGIITTGLPNLRGVSRIKLIEEGACLLLRVRGNISQQEVRMYGVNKKALTRLVHTYAEKTGIILTIAE